MEPIGTKRGFERSLVRADEDGAVVPTTPTGLAQSFFESLAEVSFFHQYYNAVAGHSPRFTVVPTPSTADLMTSLGMLLRQKGTSFAVLFDREREASLKRFLAMQGAPVMSRGAGLEYWTRLSFVLLATPPEFFAVTDMALSLSPLEWNYYFTNQEAHGSRARATLTPGEYVSSRQLLPLRPVRFQVPLEAGETAHVYDIAGRLATCEPQCREPDGSQPIEPRCYPAPRPMNVYISLVPYPEDKYRLTKTHPPDTTATDKGWFLYTSAGPQPLAFVDLFFSRPNETSAGVYPVVDPDDPQKAKIEPVQYELRFAARKTIWVYFIVPQSRSMKLTNLAIIDASPSPVSFSGPVEVVLPNGACAYRFVSREPILLEQRSERLLSLTGRRETIMDDDAVLVQRLAIADGSSFLPDPGIDPHQTYSPIYVQV